MEEPKKLLEQSAEQYRAALDNLINFTKTFSSASNQEVNSFTNQFNSSMGQIQEIDQQINLLIQQHPILKETDAFQKRFHLMDSLLKATQSLSPQIGAILAVNKAETKKIRQGMELTKGYSSNTDRTGQVISKKQ